MPRTRTRPLPLDAPSVPPFWSTVLRALREARALTQEGWATALGVGRTSVQRWERGEAVPDAFAEEALVRLGAERGLFRRYSDGPLAGYALTPSALRELLAGARLAAGSGNDSHDAPLSMVPAQAPFVGREAELGVLQAHVGVAAAGGGGRLILIRGEPGVGKTRLAREAGRCALERGACIAEGHYLRDGTPAYGPWIEALRTVVRDLPGPELTEILGAYGPDLAQIVPDLVATAGPFPAPRAVAPAEQRRRLFDGIAELVNGLSRRTPLVLLLDDLQWAPGLDLLTHVALRLREGHAVLVGTYRDQELQQQPALLRDWVQLDHSRTATEITLPLLSEPETRALVAHYLGRGVAEQLGGSVYQRTRGNAFFTEEALRSLVERGSVRAVGDEWQVVDPGNVVVPRSMQLTVEERVAHLGEGAHDVLLQASVLGQEFAFPVLAAMTGRTDEELVEIVDQAIVARVLVDRTGEGEERLAFLDDQMQEVLYSTLPPLRRRRLHLRAGGALELVYADRISGQLDQLARHYGEGNDPAKAAEYAWRAAQENSRLLHWVRARDQYERALDALARLPDTADLRSRRIETILALISIAWSAYGGERALALLAEAEALAEEEAIPGRLTGDAGQRARIDYWVGRIHYYQGDYPAGRRYLERAIASAQASGDQQLAVLCSSTIGRILWYQGRAGEAARLLVEAIESLNDETSAWDWFLTAVFLAAARAAHGDCAPALAQAQDVLLRARTTNDPVCLVMGNHALFTVSFQSGDTVRMYEAAGAHVKLSEEIGGDPLFMYLGLGFRAWAESRLGYHEIAQQSLAALRAVCARLGGRAGGADLFAAAEAEAALNAGRHADARALAERAVAQAQEVGGLFAEGIAQRVWGQALTLCDPPDWDEADKRFTASLGCCEAGELRLEAARTRTVWGRLLRDRGEVTSARCQLELAAAQFEASGLTDELREASSILRAVSPSDIVKTH